MKKQDKILFSKSTNEKEPEKKLEILTYLYQNNKQDYRLIFHLLKTLGQIEEYRSRAKELLLDLANSYNPYTIYFTIGKLELLDDNEEKAKEYFQQIPEHDGCYASAALELSKILSKEGNREEAKKTLFSILKRGDDKAAYHELGRIAELEGFYHSALRYYKQARKINEDSKILFKIGIIYKKLKKHEQAAEYFYKALSLDPDNETYITEIAKQEFLNSNYQISHHYFEKALKINPNNTEAILGLGLLQENSFNKEEAESYYLKALELDSKNGRANYRTALFYKRQGDFEKAKFFFTEALNQFEKRGHKEDQIIKVLLELVNLKLKENDIEEALYLFIKVLNNPDIYYLDINDIKRVEFYIKYKLGILEEKTKGIEKHYYDQLVSYDEKQAVKASKQFFSGEIDLEKTMQFLESKISEETFSNTLSATDLYIIDCGCPISTSKDIETNYIRAITILNTNKILYFEPYIPSNTSWKTKEVYGQTRN